MRRVVVLLDMEDLFRFFFLKKENFSISRNLLEVVSPIEDFDGPLYIEAYLRYW